MRSMMLMGDEKQHFGVCKQRHQTCVSQVLRQAWTKAASTGLIHGLQVKKETLK